MGRSQGSHIDPPRFSLILLCTVLLMLPNLTFPSPSDPSSCLDVPHVAFTFTGHVRTFADPRITTSILENLINGIIPDECVRERAHLFMLPNVGGMPRVTKVEGDATYRATKGMESFASSENFNMEELKDVLEFMFKPAVRSVTVEPFDVLKVQTFYPPNNKCEANPPNSTYHQYVTLQNAYSATLQYAKMTGIEFGYYVRCRFDVAYLKPLPPLASLRSGEDSVHVAASHFPIPDQFAVIPAKYAEVYYTGPLSLFYTCPRSRMFNGEFGPNESLLYVALKVFSDVPVTYRDDLEYVIVRMGKVRRSEDSERRELLKVAIYEKLTPPPPLRFAPRRGLSALGYCL